MSIDVYIERIENGYIVTTSDDAKRKTFYPSVSVFVDCYVTQKLKDADMLNFKLIMLSTEK